MSKVLKLLALSIICGAGMTLTGIANAIIVKPTAPLIDFIFFSTDALKIHLPIGIVVALVLFFIIKQSIKILFSLAFVLLLAAVTFYYFF